MAGFHVHLRAVTLAAALGAASLIGGSCSCPDRRVDDDDDPEPQTDPACLWLISPYAYRADGTAQLIYDDARGRPATVCLCLTQDEYDSLGDRLDRARSPEEGTLLDEYNELAYDECKHRASLIEGAVDDECLAYYAAGRWLADIYFSRGAWANGTPHGFTCDEP